MDILFFAALAFFIFFKLREQLGKISDDEKDKISAKIKANQEKIIEIQKQITAVANEAIVQQNVASEKILNALQGPLQQTFITILNRCNISAEFFINGAKSAFEMIIKAFASKDSNTLKFLLADKIYTGFENAISTRNSQEKTLHSNLISIDKTEIISATIVENSAFVTVKITSRQINYFTNKAEEIIEGRKDEIVELTDIWTFKKDLTAANPNWIVSTTG